MGWFGLNLSMIYLTMFSYKRIDHFKEWLSILQDKMQEPLPDHIITDIIIPKLDNTKSSKVSQLQVKEVLKELRLHNYYEYIPHITNKINGVPTAIQFSPELEAKLCSMFLDIQKPFQKYCEKEGRLVSFPSYIYIIQRFLQLLGEDHCISHIPMTKSQEKLRRQDEIFQFICDELGWTMPA